MLDEKREEEAKKNVKNYLNEGLLKKVDKMNEDILKVLKKNPEESLKVAQLLFDRNYSNLWVIVSAYYSMFYISNAALYKLNYKVGGQIPHKVTADALIVFVRENLKDRLLEEFEDSMEEALELAGTKADELIQSFDHERIKRSRFQYELTEDVKRSKAETSLKRAKEFTFEVEKLLI